MSTSRRFSLGTLSMMGMTPKLGKIPPPPQDLPERQVKDRLEGDIDALRVSVAQAVSRNQRFLTRNPEDRIYMDIEVPAQGGVGEGAEMVKFRGTVGEFLQYYDPNILPELGTFGSQTLATA